MPASDKYKHLSGDGQLSHMPVAAALGSYGNAGLWGKYAPQVQHLTSLLSGSHKACAVDNVQANHLSDGLGPTS